MKHLLKKIIKKIDFAGKRQNSIDYCEAKSMMKNDKNIILLDVRSPQEYKEGHLEGSINLPLYDIERKASNVLKQKEATIIVCCQTGGRSKKAIEILENAGYTTLYNIRGGLDEI